ncbi:MAG: hypothetical protein EOO10_22885 [Chitinophagaceae bacterium]|nr:MAG: hypothetical protein EOO10_22885 [Chitinophagaceae bacterium]
MNDKNNENKQRSNNETEETKIYLTPDSTLQTPEEHQHDQQVDPRKDNTISVSNDDLRETDIDRFRDEIDGKRGTTEGGE